ncbi:hypothetical protein ON010_g6813 [Phytophthora cinnamomi]|nr:hypothetical protein ON010_g6813 [Phytophthora cinnamomi]
MINSTGSPGLPISPKAYNAAPSRKNPPITLDIIAAASVSRPESRGSDAKVALKAIDAHRERRRLSMTRLRKEQRDLTTKLETCIQDDIDKLRRRRYSMLCLLVFYPRGTSGVFAWNTFVCFATASKDRRGVHGIYGGARRGIRSEARQR